MPDTGVILVNLGTPAAPTAQAVRAFLQPFLSDRRVVDLPRRIESAHHFCHLPGIKLSPSLVEQNPERHARCIVKLMNRLAALPLPPLSSRF